MGSTTCARYCNAIGTRTNVLSTNTIRRRSARRFSGSRTTRKCGTGFARGLPTLILVLSTGTGFARGLPTLILVRARLTSQCAETFVPVGAVGGGV